VRNLAGRAFHYIFFLSKDLKRKKDAIAIAYATSLQAQVIILFYRNSIRINVFLA
jgi:hypothetical protein